MINNKTRILLNSFSVFGIIKPVLFKHMYLQFVVRSDLILDWRTFVTC